MTIRCVLFDAVGTLITPREPVAAVYRRYGARFGSRSTLAELEQRLSSAFRQVFRDDAAGSCEASEALDRVRWKQVVSMVFPDVRHAGQDLFELLWNYFAEPTSWVVFSDVEPTFRSLDDRATQYGIASNFDRRIETIAAGHPALRLPACLYYSTQIGYAKPDARFFRSILESLQLAPDEILYVGDDPRNDGHGATSAGWHCVLVKRGTKELVAAEETVSVTDSPPRKISSLSEVPGLLAEIGEAG